MKKDTKFQMRISTSLLNAFDQVVGHGNRSKVITELMEGTVELSGKFKKITLRDGKHEFHHKG